MDSHARDLVRSTLGVTDVPELYIKFQSDSDHFWSYFYKFYYVLKSLLGNARQRSLEKFSIFSLKPRIGVKLKFCYVERGQFKTW